MAPNLSELSIEGNPIVERTLQDEFEARDDYLESPGHDLDHFQGTAYKKLAVEKLPVSVKILDCL